MTNRANSAPKNGNNTGVKLPKTSANCWYTALISKLKDNHYHPLSLIKQIISDKDNTANPITFMRNGFEKNHITA